MRIVLSSLYPYAYMLLYMIIPFDDYIRAWPNILMGVLVVAFPFVISKSDLARIKQVPMLILLGFFAYLVINAALLGRFEDDLSVLKKILISVGLVLLYLPIQGINKIQKAIVFSSLAAIVFSVVHLVILANSESGFQFGDSAMLIEGLLIDRIYLGLLCVLSILVSYSSLESKYHPYNRYYVGNIIINVIFILFIVSRITILALIFLFLMGQLYRSRRGPQMMVVTGTLVLIIAGAVLLNKDFRHKLSYTDQTESTDSWLSQAMKNEPRSIIWDSAYDVAEEEGLTWMGIGFMETNKRLMAQYDQRIQDPEVLKNFQTKRYNTHNQYIDFYLASGLLGLLIFLSLLVVLFFRNFRILYPTALLATFMIYAFVENLFHRQIGAYYAGFVFILLCLHFGSKQIQEDNHEKPLPQ